ncbi:Na+/H+ antiporter NhaA [Paramicrobacterium humi]|uniref:Na(+)/H(+) antiporter NhaA n=1 Tax=Paramicrobacterium humi TaxID=640635 RepID=A0A1H4M4H8_9MICO|nr:Na+/H+ antiporter NhaA [Microbacterium humi]SEB77312.1 Na+/H+ antiporter NhaA [Microbacterium humi]
MTNARVRTKSVVRRAPRRFRSETLAAVILVAATVAALVWANVGSSYAAFWNTHAAFSVGGGTLDLTVKEWVDEALMTVFFFAIGLDVRREFALGELRRPAAAMLPILAAIGGLVIPALVFLLINPSGPASSAWGAVISTVTAFAIGMLALIGPRSASSLRVFVLGFAVVDDIGALTVIALFYTQSLQPLWLIPIAAGLGLTWWLARRGVWRSLGYIVIGVIVWYCTLQSGVHATLAGVLLALLMPVYATRMSDVDSAARVTHLFRQTPRPDLAALARSSINRATPLNQRLSQAIEPYSQFVVVPLFALSNAGVALSGEAIASAFASSLTWGILAGLVVGKLIGVGGTTALVLKLRPAKGARGLDVPRSFGVGALGGVGFTISLLVIDLGVPDRRLADEARIGVLLAAVVAVLVAWLIFALGTRFAPLPPPRGLTLPRRVDPQVDHVRGPASAPVTIVVYADMGELYRTRVAEALSEAHRIFGDDVRIVYRHHIVDQRLVPVAIALEAAGAQDRFWQVHDRLSRQAEPPTVDGFLEVAASLGVDTDKLTRDVRELHNLDLIQSQSAEADDAGLPHWPAVFLNGRRLLGPANTAVIARAVRRTLESTENTG